MISSNWFWQLHRMHSKIIDGSAGLIALFVKLSQAFTLNAYYSYGNQ